MSLPWFAFDADAFTGDTAHLTTEETGAYLLLMLAYYRSEKPLPARDRALAAICKLPIDQWLEAKITLAEFFIEQDGVWRHERIEFELAERVRKHQAVVQRGKDGATKRWGNKPAKPSRNAMAIAQPSLNQCLPDGSKVATERLKPSSYSQSKARLSSGYSQTKESSPIDSSANGSAIAALKKTDAQEQEHINSLSARAREGDQAVQGKVKEEPFCDDGDIGTVIDPKFWPSDNRLAVCKFDGADEETIKREVSGFIDHKLQSGAFSNDWDASWGIWWKRWQERRDKDAAKQAKKETRTKPSPVTTETATSAPSLTDGSYIPTTAELDRMIPMWLTGVRWPRTFGPEPGMARCRIPKSILEKHGIDPKTGMKLPEDAKV